MTRAFVYTEVQIAIPFADAPWSGINESLKPQPGLLNKTWLAGVDTHSLGGLYQFARIEDAQKFVTGYFPVEARSFGAPQTTRIFNADVVAEASRDMVSPHFEAKLAQSPGAFVYTEVQASVQFDEFPWQDRNAALKQAPGLLSKTWLSGIHTGTIGGFDAFDTIENARTFATDIFPETTSKMNAAYTTRLFDGSVVVEASRDMGSPFYASS